MNRPMKFRVWNELAQQWDKCLDGSHYCIYPEVQLISQGKIFQQFSGLKDKVGKEIYEGDILHETTLFHGIGDLYICQFVVNGWSSEFQMNNTKKQWKFGGYVANHLTIVGNIFEHSKLLQ